MEKVYYVNLEIDNFNRMTYNYLFTTSTLWNTIYSVGGKYALLFQTDCLLLKDNVDKYLRYDFIGAPWNKPMHNLKHGFNGGLSLRNVETMIHITSICLPVSYEDKESLQITELANEDVYFAYHMFTNEKSFQLPSYDIAKTFSIETIYYNDPVGLHKPHSNIFESYSHYTDLLSKKHVS